MQQEQVSRRTVCRFLIIFLLCVALLPSCKESRSQPFVVLKTSAPKCSFYLAGEKDLGQVSLNGSLSANKLGVHDYSVIGSGTIEYKKNKVTIEGSQQVLLNEQPVGAYCSYVLKQDGSVVTGFLREYE